jgi:hypothetical protein
MKDKDYFDNMMKSVIDDSISNIETSRDIFNEAWNKKEKKINKRKYFNMQFMKRAALVPACCAALALVGVFTFSPGARAAAQGALKTIFVLDEKSGKVVEESEDEAIDDVNLGGFEITDKNKKDTEEKLGIEFNLPEKIADYSTTKVAGYSLPPVAMMTVKDMKYKDEENLLDKFKKAVGDDETFKELSKDYKMERRIASSYKDSQGHKFYVYLSKYSGDSEMDFVKETTIDNIKCRVLEKKRANYERGENGDDVTKKPTSVDKVYYMDWNYNGVSYHIYIGKNSSDIDAATQFAEDYIKILKQK